MRFLLVTLVVLMTACEMVLSRDIRGPIKAHDRRTASGRPIPDPSLRNPGHVHPQTAQPYNVQPVITKGEYACGPNMDQVCKLTPGVVPKGCNGLCQYPIII